MNLRTTCYDLQYLSTQSHNTNIYERVTGINYTWLPQKVTQKTMLVTADNAAVVLSVVDSNVDLFLCYSFYRTTA